MAHKKMVLTQAGTQAYRTRMLVGDPVILSATDARRLAKIGWVEEPKAKRSVREAEAKDGYRHYQPVAHDDLPALRDEYRAKLGKNPFNGWDAATLREKIAEA